MKTWGGNCVNCHPILKAQGKSQFVHHKVFPRCSLGDRLPRCMAQASVATWRSEGFISLGRLNCISLSAWTPEPPPLEIHSLLRLHVRLRPSGPHHIHWCLGLSWSPLADHCLWTTRVRTWGQALRRCSGWSPSLRAVTVKVPEGQGQGKAGFPGTKGKSGKVLWTHNVVSTALKYLLN